MKALAASYSWLVVLAGLTGCGTEEVRPDVLRVELNDGLDPEAAALLMASAGPGGWSEETLHLRVDGRLAVADFGNGPEYIGVPQHSGAMLPSGAHVLDLVDARGGVVLSTGPVEMTAGSLHYLVAFGSPGAREHAWFVDDPAQIPADNARMRLLNTVDSRAPVQPLRCGLDTPCEPLGPALQYGEMFKQDVYCTKAAELAWQTVGGNQITSMVNWGTAGGYMPALLIMPTASGGQGGLGWGGPQWCEPPADSQP